MVSSLNIPENTGAPLAGQPVPVKGLHSGEEYGRIPTSVIGVPPAAPVTIHAAAGLVMEHGMFCPFGPPPTYGRWRTCPCGSVNEYGLSSPKDPQPCPRATRSKQVCGLPGLTS